LRLGPAEEQLLVMTGAAGDNTDTADEDEEVDSDNKVPRDSLMVVINILSDLDTDMDLLMLWEQR